MRHAARRRSRRIGLALVLMIGCIPITGPAGRIQLDNGRHVEGVIEDVTDRHVIMRIGGGRILFDRDRVIAIEPGDPDKRREMLEQWQRDHFLASRFVPQGLEHLATDMRRLLRQREGMTAVRQSIRELETRERSLLAEGEALQQRIAETQRQLEAADPDLDPVDYNRRVTAANLAGLAWKDKQREIESVRDRIADQQAHLSDYMRNVDRLDEQRRKVTREPTDEQRVFLEALAARLEPLHEDFETLNLQTTRHGSVNVIEGSVNNRRQGRFIVDTGAGVVTLSAAFAERAGIPTPPPEAPTVQVVLADGRRVNAHPVLLDSLQVAGHTERQVAAVILPEPPGKHVDGLLGMSFLRRFHVSMDPSGNLVLRRFRGSPP